MFFAHQLGDARDLVGDRLVRAYLPGEQVLRLREAEALEQRGVVRWIVGHPDHRRLVEPLDEETAFLVGRVRRRAPHDVHPARGEPARGGFEQRARHGRIVLALEAAEESDPVAVKLVVRVVDDRLDAADRTAVAARQEERRVRMAEERVAQHGRTARDAHAGAAARSAGARCGDDTEGR